MNPTIDNARKELLDINNEFKKGMAFPSQYRKDIYYQLTTEKNIDVDNSILISWLPEGDDFVSGCIINQNEEIIFFDINAINPSFSEWDSGLIENYIQNDFYKKMKPWHCIKLGIELWKQNQGMK